MRESCFSLSETLGIVDEQASKKVGCIKDLNLAQSEIPIIVFYRKRKFYTKDFKTIIGHFIDDKERSFGKKEECLKQRKRFNS